jgi:hypothetical protein
MGREHAEIRKLVAQLGDLSDRLVKPGAPGAESIELTRVLYRLYSILKVPLREESLYIPILEHNLDERAAEGLVVAMDHAARVEL